MLATLSSLRTIKRKLGHIYYSYYLSRSRLIIVRRGGQEANFQATRLDVETSETADT
jgi:hypothetical protein